VATRTFLTDAELVGAKDMLLPPLATPHGQVYLDHSLTVALDFSSWLSLTIESRLREVPGWEAAAPIAIGSWGRGELCPGSDLDVVFCGDSEAVNQVVRFVEAQGLKFRYRVPQDMSDWTVGVEPLETNALFKAKAFTQEGAEKLQVQKDQILKRKGTFRRQLLQALSQERRARFKRYDSIANFLEPNLKFGAGALRDLHQAVILTDWFPERFQNDSHALKVFDYYKCLLLLIRHKLHLNNFHDILTAPDQQDLSTWLGFDSTREFMVEVQKGLSRVSFHSEWVIERCQLKQKQLQFYDGVSLSTWGDSVRLLTSDTSFQAQSLVRRALYESQGFKKEKLSKLNKGRYLKKILDIKQEDDVTVAAFRSHLISHLVPSFTSVIGLVQHDQYHRYSVDAHLLQAVREVKHFFEHPKMFGRLQFYAEKLKLSDWNILRWAALYHDIAKGQGGDHAQKGKEIASRDLRGFGLSKDQVIEVVWLVDNHLLLSNAAFRKNPHSPLTWKSLFDHGVRGARLYRLAIFTVIDIMATNPEAWNSWKENLMVDLIESLRNPSREIHYDFSQKIKRKGLDVPQSFINNIDPSVVESISHRVLLKDFEEILEGKELPPLVLRDQKNRIWVRFHRKQDQRGLVLGFTQSLTSVGCNIRQAFIHTDPVMGVIDWFCVKTTRPMGALRKQLLHNISKAKHSHCQFSKIDLMSVEENEWVFSFRAKDKKGLLLSAIEALYECELEIVWAKVHTWGRQIDDIFGVAPKPDEDPEQILKKLKKSLEVPELELL
jgi:[protein-PII] uridylyltransferase